MLPRVDITVTSTSSFDSTWHLICRACAAARAEKAKKVFPRPVAGLLRPIVSGQTIKYNLKKRAGKGFTFEELKVRKCPVSHRAAHSGLKGFSVEEGSIPGPTSVASGGCVYCGASACLFLEQ